MADRPEVDFDVELAGLAGRWGTPLRVIAELDDVAFDPVRDSTRTGHLLLVVRPPNGRLLPPIKTFYPRPGWRLPPAASTRRVDRGRARREIDEETGLEHEILRFLPRSVPRRRPGAAVFHTFCFLVRETGGTLAVKRPGRRIEAFQGVEPDELLTVAATLDAIGGDAGHLGPLPGGGAPRTAQLARGG